jgi:hypothetical protein
MTHAAEIHANRRGAPREGALGGAPEHEQSNSPLAAASWLTPFRVKDVPDYQRPALIGADVAVDVGG